MQCSKRVALISSSHFSSSPSSPLIPPQVLRSLTYQNLHSTNRLTGGTRSIRVAVNDTQLLGSSLEDIVATIGEFATIAINKLCLYLLVTIQFLAC